MEWIRQNEYMLVRINEEVALNEIVNLLNMGNTEKLINTRKLQVERKKVDSEYVCQKGDTIRLHAFPEQEIDFIPEYHPLHIVYEDDFLLVVDKPAGMLVHPDSKEGKGTLANAVAYYYEGQGLAISVRPLHRLDVETSGLVVFSKSPLLQPHFDNLLSEKKIDREYYAFVDGYYRKGQRFSVELPIGRDRHDAKKRRVSQTGKWAKTNFECISSSREANCSLVRCTLESGRTHQIRVHLEAHKHPIISDPLYGSRYEFVNRMALQAYKVSVESPLYDETLVLEIPMAKDLRKGFNKTLKLK